MFRFGFMLAILACFFLGQAGKLATNIVPGIGGAALAIIIGMIFGNLLSSKIDFMKTGMRFCERTVLASAIAMMGLSLNFSILKDSGFLVLAIIVMSVGITVLSAGLLSRFFKFERRFGVLVGCGNAVCGSSAIGAVSPVLNSSREEIGLSISVVNLLGTIGIFMIPALAKLTHLTDVQLPIFIGTSLQAVGQVAAAGFTIGTEAGEQAILVKMIRILMLGVLIVVLKLCFSVRGTQTDKKATLTDYVPVFMLVFIAFSLLRTFAQLPEGLIDGASNLQHVLLLTAMAAIGASINFKKLIHQAPKVLIFATANWAVQLIFLLLVFKVLAGFFN